MEKDLKKFLKIFIDDAKEEDEKEKDPSVIFKNFETNLSKLKLLLKNQYF